ncbi:hypothetical protein L484_019381 [Morus notabilis]|uniref:Uncharacterized protein n=1 Tax=Morus notabilis TaxID=981085 RepID=W9RZX5_9ROSA|nr:hypothetical protein L484_019381 [Morus notabilis]
MVSAQLRSDQRANKCGEETADLMSFDTAERTAQYCLGTRARMLIATGFGRGRDEDHHRLACCL